MLIQHQAAKVLLCLVAGVAAFVFVSDDVYARPDSNSKPIKILIVDGFSNHDWRQTTRVIRQILGDTRLFDIEVSTTPLPQMPQGGTRGGRSLGTMMW